MVFRARKRSGKIRPASIDVESNWTSLRLRAFVADLWQLLQNPVHLVELQQILLRYYFKGRDISIIPITESEFKYPTVDELIADAETRLRETVAKSREYKVIPRGSSFRAKIRGIYHDECAVCSLRTHILDGSTILDAAHIVPYSISHCNLTGNGVALCKNHHWGFDRGWFCIDDNYQIIPSPKLISVADYIPSRKLLLLPNDTAHAPRAEFLDWHRQNIYIS